VAEKAFESMRSRVEVHRRAAQRSGSGGFATHSEGAIEPRNLILYGPPGTGKTHRIQKLFADYTDASVNVDAEEWLRQRVADFGWRPVIAAAMAALGRPARVPEIRDHAWVVAKTQERGRIGSNVDQTLWGFLMAHTPEEVETVRYASRRPPFIFTKSEGSLWNLLKDWREQDPEGAKLHALLTAGPERDVSDVRRYRAVTFHPSYSYEDFVRGIRPVVDEETGQTSFRSVDGIFKQICDEARKNPGKQYALFIDEINRANIAKVFGELITLLEPDKRARYSADGKLVGGMVVQLPGGSGTEVVEEPFGVPANLDVYGTMNTADRSIALLDIALRRRFEFEEMLPEYGLLSAAVEGVDVGRMLRRINDRLEYLLDRDHRIGHAYIMRAKSVEDLRRAFRLQIIPLLQEYFFDDFARVALVLATPRGVPPFLVPERVVQGALFAAGLEGGVPAERTRYSVAEPSSWTEASFAGLYTESRAADPQ
jgi:5-methylcytosine-specific restriction protein B